MMSMRKHIAFASMCMGLFIAQLDIQIVSSSLNEIGGGLSAGKDEMAWLQTSHLIAEIIVIPLSGWLSRVFSTRWLFTLSAGIFTLMSIACGLAWNIQIMILFRALQGAAGASMIPLVFTTAFIYYQGKELGLAAAVVSALASLSPTLGPTLGCFFSFSGGVGIFSTVYLIPVFLGQIRGLNAEEIGFAVCTTGIFQLFSVPFYFWLSKKINLRWLLMAGLGGFVFSMYLFTPITHEWGWQELLFPQAIRGISQQFAMAPIVTLTLGGIPKERLKLASGVFNLTRNLGGAIGIALCGSILNNRTNFHFSRMGEKMVSVPHTVNDFISRSALFFNRSGSDQTSEILASTKLLSQLMLREAQTMAFSDTFLLISGLLFIAFLLVPAMNKSS
ncbi:multidrug efflux MFS transporter [Escherichia coli]